MNVTERLAREFATVIRRDLDPLPLAEVIRINKIHPENCATGDMIDSNMSMDEAFIHVMKRETVADADNLAQSQLD